LKALKLGKGRPLEIHRSHIENHSQKAQKSKVKASSDPFEHVPQDYKKVAQSIEQQFAEYMLKQMHTSIGREESNDSAMNYYEDLNQKEQAKTMAQVNSGLGIQKLILDEIYPEKFRNPEAIAAYNQHKENSQIKKNKIEMMGPPSELKPTMKEKASINIGREANHE
jgi:Rod binding domain-containing protein